MLACDEEGPPGRLPRCGCICSALPSIVLVALTCSLPLRGSRANLRHSGLAAKACRHGRRPNRPRCPEEGTRALQTKKNARASSEIPATSPRMPHARVHRRPANRAVDFYIICESRKSFRAVFLWLRQWTETENAQISRTARQCAKHFSNAEGSKLTTGGSYVTAENANVFQRLLSQIGQAKTFPSHVSAF